jgi:KUP system potassium uptake protein
MTAPITATTRRRATLGLGALGVVFGDIGTSPLYALRESLAGENELAVNEANILGVLSLIVWSLLIVVTLKYLVIVMRADNDGEGGILALAALIVKRGGNRRRATLIMLALFGTALLYGDGMITPAISVLSAVEGIEVAAPSVHAWVKPIAAVILIGLFAVQHRGTSTIGRFFGPVMVLWFSTLALLGIVEMAGEPGVARALSPIWAARFFADNGGRGFLVLGSVFLVVTGGEALYADMGHFGRRSIQAVWYGLVLPALVLNYFGQGALLLRNPEAIENPFFLLAPGWAHWPLTVLATAATVIASQALITGAFSLTVQAIHLDYLPRLHTVQTSDESRGHVYVPAVNWFLLAACLILVFAFGTSSRLAAAYGVAVTMTMVITTLLVGHVAYHRWGWSALATSALTWPLLVVDIAFASANVFKIPDGGWFPLLVGLLGFLIFTTWRTGRGLVAARLERKALSVADFVAGLANDPPIRHLGTGVYLHRTPGLVPPVLLTNLRFNESLHEQVVILSIISVDAPTVPAAARAKFTHHPLGFHELELRYGYADQPRVADDLAKLVGGGVSFDEEVTTYFLGRERVDVTERPGMAIWREHLFAFLHRNAADPAQHFSIPRAHTVDIGTHVDI